jgi:hypothetical protein
MKDYKGLYHGEQANIKLYEHGAHFKYSDLVNALNKLLARETQNEESDIKSNSKKETSVNKEKKKKVKKYKLNINKENSNVNQRYNNIFNSNVNLNEKDKNIDNILEHYSFYKIKEKVPLNPISKSVDRSNVNLPKIINNINSNLNTNNLIPINLKKQSYNSKQLKKILNENNNEKNREEILPLLGSLYHKQGKKEKDSDNNIKIENIKLNSVKKPKNKRNLKIFLKEINNTENSKGVLNGKLKSIFDTEKPIKKNNLINQPNNDYYSKNYIETVNNDISRQMYLIKKQLMGNSNKKESTKLLDI